MLCCLVEFSKAESSSALFYRSSRVGYIESFNGKLRDELLNLETFYTLIEAKVLMEQRHKEYNQVSPHSSLDYRPRAFEAGISALLT